MVTLCSFDILVVHLFWLFSQLTFASDFCPRHSVSDGYVLLCQHYQKLVIQILFYVLTIIVTP